MRVEIGSAQLRNGFADKVAELSGVDPMSCYQCGKCSASCPLADVMEYLPNQVIRLIQLGEEEEAIGCDSIWYCASCYTCSVRCPRDVDIAKLLEAVRQIYLRRRNQEYLEAMQLDRGELRRLPPIALVSSLRKLTA